MASKAQNRAIGGVTPLGVFTITPGTPQRVTSLLNLSDTIYTFSCRQLGFSVDSSVGGLVYLNYGNYAGLDANATALIIGSGQQQTLPMGCAATEGPIDAKAWFLDGSAACVVAVYALDGSS